MLTLNVKIRKELGKKAKTLRTKGILPAVLYGPKIKNLNLEVDQKEFEKVFKETGESSLISLSAEGKNFSVLVHEVKFDSLTEKPLHVDFYEPSLKEEITAKIPIIFEGVAPVVKELGGTFVKNITELEVKAIPTRLPKEIKVDISGLKTFEDVILVKDLAAPEGVKILRAVEEIIAKVSRPEKVEEELAKPIEEKVEEVKAVKEEKKEKAAEEAAEIEKTEKTEKK